MQRGRQSGKENEKYKGRGRYMTDAHDMQFHFSPQVPSMSSLEKAKAPRETYNRTIYETISTPLAEPSFVLLVKILDTKLIEKIPFRKLNQPPKI